MDLQIFKNEEFGEVRVVILDGTIYFVGKDAADSLGYANSSKTLKDHVDPEDKKIVDLNTITNRYHITGAVSEGWIKNEVTVINESGLYSLILSSKLPTAKKFKRWITSVVLPAIRKYGVYVTPATLDNLLNDPDFAIRLFTELKNERNKNAELTQDNAVLTQQVAELQPKASYYDVVLNCKDLVSVSKIAKDYGMSAVTFNKLLHQLGVQFKQGDIWLLYQRYAMLGWTSTKTLSYVGDDGSMHGKVHTYWTQKGRIGLYELLKRNRYLPTIEAKDFYDDDELSDDEKD